MCFVIQRSDPIARFSFNFLREVKVHVYIICTQNLVMQFGALYLVQRVCVCVCVCVLGFAV